MTMQSDDGLLGRAETMAQDLMMAAALIERQAAEIKSHITNAENCYEEWKKVKKEADKLRVQLGELQMANNSNLAVIERQAAEIASKDALVNSKQRNLDILHENHRNAQAEIERQAAELREITTECEEQARLNGMGAERELGLRAEIERLRDRELELLRKLEGLVIERDGLRKKSNTLKEN